MELVIIIATTFCVWVMIALLAQKPQRADMDIDTIEKLLPQTQCGDCGFSGCRPYAEALRNRDADINRCLPGGMETVDALALLLGVEAKPLYKKPEKYQIASVALIDERHCIGCVKCIAACPVEAIIGAPKQMHSVISEYCTGCQLCLQPCPTDCISMAPATDRQT